MYQSPLKCLCPAGEFLLWNEIFDDLSVSNVSKSDRKLWKLCDRESAEYFTKPNVAVRMILQINCLKVPFSISSTFCSGGYSLVAVFFLVDNLHTIVNFQG